MKLHSITCGNFQLDGGAMFGVVPKSLWQKAYPVNEQNLCTWSMRCLLIDDGTNRILIDTGIGRKQSDKFYSHYNPGGTVNVADALAEKGYKTDDITHVILTHLHFDHAGGAIYRSADNLLRTTFANAAYYVSARQWEWATKANAREKASFLPENILPLAESGQLSLVVNEGGPLQHIDMRFFHGHTDGQIIPVINTGTHKVAYMGDLLPSSAHIPLPWVMAYDTRPLLTLTEKEAFLGEAADHNYVLFLEHDMYRACCTVEKTDKGIRLKEGFESLEAAGL